MTEWLAELMVPFSYNYMLKAMWVSALVGGVCAFLSAYLMLKGWSLMGDALAHSIVPGVAGAYILGAPFAVGAFFAGILASFAMQFVKRNSRLREDASAQWEIREVAAEMSRLARKVLPLSCLLLGGKDAYPGIYAGVYGRAPKMAPPKSHK